MEWLDLICQTVVLVLGLAAIFLLGLKNPQVRKYGYLSGLIAQPFWLYTFVFHDQYILLLAGVAYVIFWSIGFKNHFLVKG